MFPKVRSLSSASRRAWLGHAATAALAGAAWGGAEAQTAQSRGSASANQRWELTADFDPARAAWLGYAQGHDAITGRLAAALQPHVRLKYLLRDAAHAQALRALLAASRVDLEQVDFFFDPSAGYFMRDLAVFARGPDGRTGVLDLRATLYGTPTWCRRRHAFDAAAADACIARGHEVAAGRDKVDRTIAGRLRAEVLPTPLAAEGGGVEVNGQGLLIANAPYWASRNPELGPEQMQRAMLALPGVRKVIWLTGGLAEDVHLRGTITGDYVAWGTGGHTDQFVRFADERTVLLAWPDDAQAATHPVSRLTRERMERNLRQLRDATDARGRRLRVIQVPMPRPIEREVVLSEAADVTWSHEWTAEFFAPQERRRQGHKLIQVATATYLNFVLANEALVLPDYTPHGTPPERQEHVRRLFEAAFPGRRISFIDPITANWVGGGLHCVTANEPAG